jgi:cellulose synthase/poly-beta-1,6-N-acetylglucosamine synthase-like glycosyltransferase
VCHSGGVDVVVVIVTTGGDGVLPALREVVEGVSRLGLVPVILSSRWLPLERVLVVPREEDGTKYRAIRWFVRNHVDPRKWYVFLDDDSYPLDRSFLCSIAWAERSGRVAGNGILVPRPGRSRLAYALDWIRFFDDLTRFRLQALFGKPFYGLHGELLMVRGDVLKEIWPAMRESVTEDFVFAMELLRRGYKIFQANTLVSIKSPNSMRDFMRQRMRWANVLRDSIAYGNPLPLIYSVTGALCNTIFFPLWPLYGFTAATVVSLYYYAVYIYGAAKAGLLRYTPAIYLASSLEIIFFIMGAMRRQRRFMVIDKT